MSNRTRRKLKSLLVTSAHYVESGGSSFGRQGMLYDGISVLVSDFILDNESADNGAGSTFSSTYAIHFSPADELVGLTNGGIEVMDVRLAVLRDSAVARMNGISAAWRPAIMPTMEPLDPHGP